MKDCTQHYHYTHTTHIYLLKTLAYSTTQYVYKAQPLLYLKYIHSGTIHETRDISEEPPSTTSTSSALVKLNNICTYHNFQWNVACYVVFANKIYKITAADQFLIQISTPPVLHLASLGGRGRKNLKPMQNFTICTTYIQIFIHVQKYTKQLVFFIFPCERIYILHSILNPKVPSHVSLYILRTQRMAVTTHPSLLIITMIWLTSHCQSHFYTSEPPLWLFLWPVTFRHSAGMSRWSVSNCF